MNTLPAGADQRRHRATRAALNAAQAVPGYVVGLVLAILFALALLHWATPCTPAGALC